jgi:hypothetical protein
MGDYNFWSDLLDTWQSTADWIKALAILTPQATALAALALVLRHRLARRRVEQLPAGTLAYTLWRDGGDRLQVVRHDPAHTLRGPSALDMKGGAEPVGWRARRDTTTEQLG